MTQPKFKAAQRMNTTQLIGVEINISIYCRYNSRHTQHGTKD